MSNRAIGFKLGVGSTTIDREISFLEIRDEVTKYLREITHDLVKADQETAHYLASYTLVLINRY